MSAAFKPVSFQIIKDYWCPIWETFAHLHHYLLHLPEIQGHTHLPPSVWLSRVNWAISQNPRMFIADKALWRRALTGFQWLIALFCLVDRQDWLNPSRSSRQRNLSAASVLRRLVNQSIIFVTLEVLFVMCTGGVDIQIPFFRWMVEKYSGNWGNPDVFRFLKSCRSSFKEQTSWSDKNELKRTNVISHYLYLNSSTFNNNPAHKCYIVNRYTYIKKCHIMIILSFFFYCVWSPSVSEAPLYVGGGLSFLRFILLLAHCCRSVVNNPEYTLNCFRLCFNSSSAGQGGVFRHWWVWFLHCVL